MSVKQWVWMFSVFTKQQHFDLDFKAINNNYNPKTMGTECSPCKDIVCKDEVCYQYVIMQEVLHHFSHSFCSIADSPLILLSFVMEMPQESKDHLYQSRNTDDPTFKHIFTRWICYSGTSCEWLMQPLQARSSSKYYISDIVIEHSIILIKYCRHSIALSHLSCNLLHTQDRFCFSGNRPTSNDMSEEQATQRGKKWDCINHSNSSSVYSIHSASELPHFWLQTW